MITLIENGEVYGPQPLGQAAILLIDATVGRAALYNEERGFMGAAEFAQEAIEKGKSVEDIVVEEKSNG